MSDITEHQALIIWKNEVRGLRRDFNELRNAASELLAALDDAEVPTQAIRCTNRLRDVLRTMSVHDNIR